MSAFWLLVCGLAIVGMALAATPYPRSVPVLEGAEEPGYASAKIKSGDSTQLLVHAWLPSKLADNCPVALLVHGIGMHGKAYASIAAGFTTRGVILVVPDLHGHGRSEGGRGDLADVKTLRADLDAVADWINARYPKSSVVLMGESMGGLIAAEYARQSQKRFAGLVLGAPAFLIHVKRLQATSGFFGLIKTGKVPIHGDDHLGASTRDESFVKACREDPLALHKVNPNYLMQLGRMSLNWPNAGDELKLPLLVCVGGKDCIVDNKTARRVLARAPVPKKDRIWREWKEAYHTIFWDPFTPKIVDEITMWVLERSRK